MNLVSELSGALALASSASASYGVVEKVVGKQAWVQGRAYEFTTPIEPGERVLLVGTRAWALAGVRVFSV